MNQSNQSDFQNFESSSSEATISISSSLKDLFRDAVMRLQSEQHCTIDALTEQIRCLREREQLRINEIERLSRLVERKKENFAEMCTLQGELESKRSLETNLKKEIQEVKLFNEHLFAQIRLERENNKKLIESRAAQVEEQNTLFNNQINELTNRLNTVDTSRRDLLKSNSILRRKLRHAQELLDSLSIAVREFQESYQSELKQRCIYEEQLLSDKDNAISSLQGELLLLRKRLQESSTADSNLEYKSYKDVTSISKNNMTKIMENSFMEATINSNNFNRMMEFPSETTEIIVNKIIEQYRPKDIDHHALFDRRPLVVKETDRISKVSENINHDRQALRILSSSYSRTIGEKQRHLDFAMSLIRSQDQRHNLREQKVNHASLSQSGNRIDIVNRTSKADLWNTPK